MKKFTIFGAVFALLMINAPLQADVLLLDAIAEAPPNSSDGLTRPSRGMNMTGVKAKFGEPSQEYPRVGEPPITRWDYDGYSVYFEHETVLNTVVHR